jgi:3-hydroxyisobutyrate dehydrogenase-like beta-hydroxyacid dehydrogenase
MDRIAVLGLGRMGGAVAGRLAELGWEVTGWTRSGRLVAGVTPAGSPAEAVGKADAVLLALYDGPACREVLALARPDGIVVNTSTVGVAEAVALAAQAGPGYVHAPVLGSIPAAASGQLTVLAGGEAAALDRAGPVLAALGNVVPVGDVRTAAALKLVANLSLAGAVGALRDTLVQADALGLPRDRVLDVLARGQLGAFVERKRAFLTGASADAQFTVDALAKDMALLAAATGRPLRLAGELEELAAEAPGADFALAATRPGVDDEVLEPLRAYVRGHATGDPAHFDAAFLPSARIAGLREGAFVSWTLDEYRGLFNGHPAPDEATRSRRVDAVDVQGTVATASMTLHHGPDTFTDIFLLVRLDGRWWIADKAYHRQPGRT